MKLDKHSQFGLILIIISILWVYIFSMAIHSALPMNPISKFPLSSSLNVASWFPQGWGFFSKSPRDPYFSVVDVSKKKIAAAWPNNIPKNFFGLKRYGRSQGIEAGLLVSNIAETSRLECNENPMTCLRKSPVIMEIVNQTPNPTICGDVGFIYQEPVPWAWSRSSKKIEMPSEVVRVNVKCFKD